MLDGAVAPLPHSISCATALLLAFPHSAHRPVEERGKLHTVLRWESANTRSSGHRR